MDFHDKRIRILLADDDDRWTSSFVRVFSYQNSARCEFQVVPCGRLAVWEALRSRFHIIVFSSTFLNKVSFDCSQVVELLLSNMLNRDFSLIIASADELFEPSWLGKQRGSATLISSDRLDLRSALKIEIERQEAQQAKKEKIASIRNQLHYDFISEAFARAGDNKTESDQREVPNSYETFPPTGVKAKIGSPGVSGVSPRIETFVSGVSPLIATKEDSHLWGQSAH